MSDGSLLVLNSEDLAYLHCVNEKDSFDLGKMIASPTTDPHLGGLFCEYYDEAVHPIKSEQSDQNMQYSEYPPSDPTELCNTEYVGPLNFEVYVDPNGLKNPWEYSSKSNKLYIDMKHRFPINFSIKNSNKSIPQALFIRVMPTFEENRYVQELVYRCFNHAQPGDQLNQGISDQMAQHIIRCDNKHAQYFGDKNENKRLSIVIPLSKPQTGTDSVKEFFQFVCKSSCPGGMNRRPIQVVFTLENVEGEVLGRRVLCVRICSCPKRDREKDDTKIEKNGGSSNGKRKMDKVLMQSSNDLTIDSKPRQLNLTIYGSDVYEDTLKYLILQMNSKCNIARENNVSDAVFQKAKRDLCCLLTKRNGS